MEIILELRDFVYGKTIEKTVIILMMTVGILCAYLDMGQDVRWHAKPVKNVETAASESASCVTVNGMLDEKVSLSYEIEERSADDLMSPAVKTEAVSSDVLELKSEEIMESTVSDPEKSEDKAFVNDEINQMVTVKEEEMVKSELNPVEKPIQEAPVMPEEIQPDKLGTIPSDTVDKSPAEEEAVPEIRSPFLIDEAGMTYGFVPEYAEFGDGRLLFPAESCVGIRRGTFSGCTSYITEISVPVEMVNIEDGALNELLSLEWISVLPGNTMYIEKDGVLFDSTGTKLIAFPPARIGGYAIPDEVTEISENAFLNTSLSVIDIRDCAVSENCLLNISESCSIIK